VTNSPPGRQDDADRGSWLRTLYQVAHSDTRWAKEQSWRVVYWSLLLFAAELAIFKYLGPGGHVKVFIALTITILFVGIISLYDLRQSVAGTRHTTDKIQRDEFRELSRFLDLRSASLGDTFYLLVQLGVLLIAAALTIVVLCYISQQ